MSENTIEIMKKLIEAKKQKSAAQGGNVRHNQKMGEKRTGVKRHKKGGLFDK